MSMLCPKCLGAAKCYDSRRRKSTGVVYRRHQCMKCDCRFTTKEQVVKVDKRNHPLTGAPLVGQRGEPHRRKHGEEHVAGLPAGTQSIPDGGREDDEERGPGVCARNLA